MSEAELRQLLKGILELANIGRLHPDEQAAPGTELLLITLGTIAALTTRALEGNELPPQRIEISEAAFGRLIHNEPVVVQTQLGYRVELRRKPV